MKISTVEYPGELRSRAVHLRSGNAIITDAPVDNQGKGEAFSPTDLMSTSLASCMLTIMGIKARDMGLNMDGAAAEVQKFMESGPRRVGKITVHIKMPSSLNCTERDKKILQKAALSCPVYLSLHPDTEKDVEFSWAK